jgi:hypothetical protein
LHGYVKLPEGISQLGTRRHDEWLLDIGMFIQVMLLGVARWSEPPWVYCGLLLFNIIMVYHGLLLWFIMVYYHYLSWCIMVYHCYKVISLGWIPEIIPKWPIVCLTQVSELFEVVMINAE